MLIYHTFLLFAVIVFIPVILPLILTSKKRRRTVLQRLGLTGIPGNDNLCNKTAQGKRPIWIHALSVGETFACVKLVKTIRQNFPRSKIYFSVSTDTGYTEARKRLVGVVDQIFFYPYDFIFVVRKMLRRINPSIFILVESDIWPTFLFELQKMNVPAILVNGRLSPRSYEGYRRFSFVMRPVFNAFCAICVQSKEQGDRFADLGIDREKIRIAGNMKFDHKFEPLSEDEKSVLIKSAGIERGRKVFLAGSTHPGEESVLLEAFSTIQSAFPGLCLVLAPRDPERADEIRRLAYESGASVKKFSEKIPVETDVVVIDVMGLLAKLYSIADVAFVGGSLAPFGGHNPLEPASFEKPILFGPDMSDFPEISRMLLHRKGAVLVKNAKQISETVSNFLSDPQASIEVGRKAASVFQANQGAVRRIAAVTREFATDRKKMNAS